MRFTSVADAKALEGEPIRRGAVVDNKAASRDSFTSLSDVGCDLSLPGNFPSQKVHGAPVAMSLASRQVTHGAVIGNMPSVGRSVTAHPRHGLGGMQGCVLSHLRDKEEHHDDVLTMNSGC
jgi:hypothetical protein